MELDPNSVAHYLSLKIKGINPDELANFMVCNLGESACNDLVDKLDRRRGELLHQRSVLDNMKELYEIKICVACGRFSISEVKDIVGVGDVCPYCLNNLSETDTHDTFKDYIEAGGML